MTDASETTTLYCVNHPQTETGLRCNRCERPICTRCAVLTPTGYRCKDCVRGLQKTYETAAWWDYPLAFVIAGALSFFGSLIVARLGFFTILLSPVAGMIIAEAVRAAVRKRRSRALFRVATVATALGSLVIIAQQAVILLLLSSSGQDVEVVYLLSLIWPALYTFIVSSTVFYRLSGIQLKI
jgi:hypothetical protein